MTTPPGPRQPERLLAVAFLIRSLDFGGAQRQLALLADGLARRGHRVVVITFYDGRPLLGTGRPVAFRHQSLGKRSRWDLILPAIRLIRALRTTRVDVAHAYLTDANVALALTAWVVPATKMVWGLRGSGVDFAPYSRVAGLVFRLSRWLSGLPDLIITNSRAAAASHAAAGYRPRQMLWIPNGVDTAVFRPDSAARDRQRRAWGIDPKDQVVGLVARLDPMKGHRSFLQAVAHHVAQGAPGTFVCVGNGPRSFARELADLATTLGVADRVRWFPAQTNAADVYNALDLLTTASAPGEGCPNVVAEAMACGTTCVVTDSGDSADLVGDAGVVVPPNDPIALAAGWREALRRRGESGGSGARTRIEAEYGLEALVSRTEEALRVLVDSPPTGGRR